MGQSVVVQIVGELFKLMKAMMGATVMNGQCGMAVWVAMLVAAVIPSQVMAQSAADYRQQGLSLRDQERYPEAIAALQKAVELEPDHLSGLVLLGWTQHRGGQRADATATLLNALSLNPFDVPTLNALGIVFLVDGQLDRAIASHGWATLLKPNNEVAYYNLSLAFERIKQYEWAIAAARAAAKLEPTNPHPPVAEAIAHWSNGNQAAAQAALQQAIALDSRYTDANFLRYLDEFGFSQEQVQLSQAVLASIL
ncbi:MAG: tetratricopeptide repeat protein [Leptolyngbyaceae cyanobacterium bins.349]|nr:tetratricopeptide repeat protein [Leptolyngbyaceae cyanobacterium bins.349]